jgi:GT2 family glycosyltransferase/glycosyltransferase involved in cell wall biosynthesis
VSGVSIVIPIYNALNEARECVDSIYAARTSIPFEVIAVDNGSAPDVADWLAGQNKSRPNFKWLRFDEPLGFARAMNEGARHVRHDFVALLNSDTLVTEDWLDILADALRKDPALGVASPVTNRCGHDVQCDPEASLLNPEDAPRYAASIRGRAEVIGEPQRLVFFCVLLRRTLWDQLAGFDESFRTGNFEDDDFCLRARMAGYRLALVRSAFVYHAERRTFEANRLNHGETLASNQALFAARASRWSRTLRPPIPDAARADSLSVIVPVTAARASGLRDSLASLANQTVRGFETVVVAGLDLSPILSEFSGRLRLRSVCIDEAEGPAPLLNAGLQAASGSEIAYLPSADIYYPFHLEALLQNGGCAFSAWNVSAERRTPVMFPEAEPGVELGDWAPLLCWLHRRDPSLSFDPSFGAFAPWAFTIQLRDSRKPRYLCRVTCERTPDAPSPSDASDVERVMRRFPVANAWQESQRAQFLEGVRQGNWEDRLIVQRQDRARRARALLSRAQADTRELAKLRARLEEVPPVCSSPLCSSRVKPDILLFSIIEWNALTQRPHHFATGLAARGHRVFWIDVRLRAPERVDSANLVREMQPGLFQIELPAHPGEIYRMEWRPEILETMLACFAHIRAGYGIAAAWQLVNFPRWEPLVAALAEKFGWPVAYDCLDDQQAFASLYGHDLAQFETTLLKTSAKVLASGHTLFDKTRALRADAAFIPNAADFALFSNAKSGGLLDGLPRPIAGFFGAFADWLDFDWIDAAARRFPAWSFVYIGREGFAKPSARERWKSVTDKPNVHVYPQATPEKLAQFLAQMDVCVMPFQDLPVTRSMNAVKLFEYLAAGKPVVAPELPETNPLRALIATYRFQEESFQRLEAAIQSTPEAAKARQEFAAQNTWNHRLDALCAALGL